ncbi:Phosphate ABC transporter, periplasmic phosphate-binding protein PstS [Candidatus Nitrosotalea sp. TS]|uniref:hypothetical protein n=1 Tax=Candidatus Nitrosotalea sp. TS TaxID=2341020 RepID=UPI00140E1A6C|nr:hypothetical protein [Candidatus Nitrosotalea sp. TS]NHI04363.1 Phosphate ABC transporter, periplasmic phosphate-binding protein PstS [Candidatus Nitrosotalea sp. TS]
MKKILLALAFTLLLIIPATMLHASAQTSQSYTITGAGSTFVYPLMDTWRVQYNNLHSNIRAKLSIHRQWSRHQALGTKDCGLCSI